MGYVLSPGKNLTQNAHWSQCVYGDVIWSIIVGVPLIFQRHGLQRHCLEQKGQGDLERKHQSMVGVVRLVCNFDLVTPVDFDDDLDLGQSCEHEAAATFEQKAAGADWLELRHLRPPQGDIRVVVGSGWAARELA